MPPAPRNASSSSSSRSSSGSSSRVGGVVGDDEDATSRSRSGPVWEVLKDRTKDGGAVDKTPATGGTCTWYADGQCSKPRSCYDCLNTVLDGRECGINEFGVCADMREFDRALDFRRRLPPDSLQAYANHFPGTNTSYCRVDDPYCSKCRAAWASPMQDRQLARLQYCRGVGGCVCTQACEVSYRTDYIKQGMCSYWGIGQASQRTMYLSMMIIGTLCIFFAVVSVVFRKCMNRRQPQRSQVPHFRSEPPVRRRQPSGPQLALGGWHSMREKLIETEREHIQGTETTLATPALEQPADAAPPPAGQAEGNSDPQLPSADPSTSTAPYNALSPTTPTSTALPSLAAAGRTLQHPRSADGGNVM